MPTCISYADMQRYGRGVTQGLDVMAEASEEAGCARDAIWSDEEDDTPESQETNLFGSQDTAAETFKGYQQEEENSPQNDRAEEGKVFSLGDGALRHNLVLCKPAQILRMQGVNREDRRTAMEIHPQTFLDGRITEAHLKLVFRGSDQHSTAREGAIKVFSDLQKKVRNLIGHVLTSWFMQAARQLDLIDGTEPGGPSTVAAKVVENPTRENFKKLWFVMFGAFDYNRKLFHELEQVVMDKCNLRYKAEWVKLEIKKPKITTDEDNEFYNERPDTRSDFYGVGCIGQQTKMVLQNRQKNINRKLMTELGVSITKSKPLLLTEKHGVKKVVQQRRRVKSIFEPCFVRIKNFPLWQKVCEENRIPPEETAGYTRKDKGNTKKDMGRTERAQDLPNRITPWKGNAEGSPTGTQVR